MRDAKDVNVEHAIVHIIDHLKKKDNIIASEIELDLVATTAKPLRDYFTAQVKNALKDGQTGSAKFSTKNDQTAKDEAFRILADQKQFVSSSQKLARSLLAAMGTDGRITPGNLVVCTFGASNYSEKFLALFKIDPTNALIEKVERQNGKQVVTFDVQSDVMPTAREKLHKAALITPAGMDKKFDLLLLDRQVAAVAANFFAVTFLNTTPVLEPLSSTKSFLFATEKARKILMAAPEGSPERIGPQESDVIVQHMEVAAQSNRVDRISWPKRLPLKPEAQEVVAKQLEKQFPQDRNVKIDKTYAKELLKKTRYRGDHGVLFEVETDRHDDVVIEQVRQPPLPDGTVITRLVLEVPNFHRVTS